MAPDSKSSVGAVSETVILALPVPPPASSNLAKNAAVLTLLRSSWARANPPLVVPSIMFRVFLVVLYQITPLSDKRRSMSSSSLPRTRRYLKGKTAIKYSLNKSIYLFLNYFCLPIIGQLTSSWIIVIKIRISIKINI